MSAWVRALARVLFVVLTFAALPAPGVRADDASESRTRRELGQEYYRQRRYQEALDMFLEAYRLVQTPTLAHDLAQTYALLERPVQAFNWYQTFLAVSDGEASLAEARAETTRAIDVLRAHVAVVDLSTDPPGAEVFVDRVELGSWGTTPIELAVPPGPHVLTLRRTGHHDASAPIDVALGQRSPSTTTLSPIVGHLVIRSRPDGATIAIEQTGAVLGTTPLAIDLPIGEVRLLGSAAGYVDSERTVTLAEDRATEVTIELAREASTVAVLSVAGAPLAAHVLVDGADVGAIPLTIDTLSVGTHTVRVESDGLEPIERSVLLESGGAARLDVALRPPPDWPWPTVRWIPYGIGAATLVGAIVTGVLALEGRDAFYADPTRAGLDAQRTMTGVTDVLLGVGAGILAVTFVLDLALQAPTGSTAEIVLDR